MNDETRWNRIHAAALGVNFIAPSVPKTSSRQAHSIPARHLKLRADWRLVYGGLPRLEMRWFAVFHPRSNRDQTGGKS
jgi:hypothetical protein